MVPLTDSYLVRAHWHVGSEEHQSAAAKGTANSVHSHKCPQKDIHRTDHKGDCLAPRSSCDPHSLVLGQHEGRGLHNHNWNTGAAAWLTPDDQQNPSRSSIPASLVLLEIPTHNSTKRHKEARRHKFERNALSVTVPLESTAPRLDSVKGYGYAKRSYSCLGGL
jgi:hypothetical protein